MKKLATLLMLFIVLLGNTILAQTDTTKTHIKSFLVKSNFEQRVAGLKGLSINSYITRLVNQTNNPNFNFTTQGKFIAGEYNTAVNNGKTQNHWTEKQLPLFIEIGKELQGTYPFLVFEVPQKPTEKPDRLPYKPEYASFTTKEEWDDPKMTIEEQIAIMEAFGVDAKKATEDYMKKIIEENKKLEKDTKNQ